MEHLENEQTNNLATPPNGELNKSKAPQRVSSLNCEPDPARPMVKPHSVIAWPRLLMETAHAIFRSAVARTSKKKVPLKKNVKNYVGIDIASETLAVSVLQSPDKPVITRDSIANNEEGFKNLLRWFKEIHVTPSNSVVCTEATGVYGEALSYCLVAQGFQVAIEPPLKVKRAF